MICPISVIRKIVDEMVLGKRVLVVVECQDKKNVSGEIFGTISRIHLECVRGRGLKMDNNHRNYREVRVDGGGISAVFEAGEKVNDKEFDIVFREQDII